MRFYLGSMLAIMALGLAGCGSNDSGPIREQANGPIDVVDTSPVGEVAAEPEQIQDEALVPGDVLLSSEMVWVTLDRETQKAAIDEFMLNFGHKFPKITARTLLEAAAYHEESGTFATIDTGLTLQQGLKVIAGFAESNEIYEAKSKYLPSKKVVGMTSNEVRVKLGPPARDQDISGIGVVWYYDLENNTYQVIFSNDTVSAVNKY